MKKYLNTPIFMSVFVVLMLSGGCAKSKSDE